jgi:ABC-type nitrate/sulfonate/bicarbonate transport system substrate-binding protein
MQATRPSAKATAARMFRTPPSRMDRRTFLKRLGAAGAGAALAGPALAPWSRADGGGLQRIAYQLGWIKNFQFAGDYIADFRGYYRRFGLEVDLLSGGPTVNVEPILMSGKALVAQSMPDFMANANAKGATITCIAACYQRNVDAIISLAKSPLAAPREMIGRKIGIQLNNLVPWHAFLKLNRIDPASINNVPVQYDLTPLVTGEVDGFFGEVIDDAVQLTTKGIEIHCMPFADFGYNMLTATYVAKADSLADRTRRAQIVAFMKGDLLGWQDSIKDPELSARLTVDVYGKGNGLDLKRQEASCLVANDFIVSPATRKHGLFWMSPESVGETIASLAAAGVKATADMFTNEILEEAYAGINAGLTPG